MPTGRIALSSSGSPFTMAFWKQVGLSWEGLIYRGCGHCRVCWCSRSLISYNNDCSGVICVCVCVHVFSDKWNGNYRTRVHSPNYCGVAPAPQKSACTRVLCSCFSGSDVTCANIAGRPGLLPVPTPVPTSYYIAMAQGLRKYWL